MSNTLSLALVILAMTISGMLLYRVLHARRIAVRIIGGLAVGLPALVLALFSMLGVRGMIRMRSTSSFSVPPAGSPSTAEQIARGQYIAGVACVGCHGDKEKFPLSGGRDMAAEIPIPIGSLVAANITPGGLLKELSDDDLFRVLRYGYDKNGRQLVMMSQLATHQLSDDDTRAVIAYLRSQPAVETSFDGGDRLNLLGVALLHGAGMLTSPHVETGVIVAPPAAENAEYGKYVAAIGDCRSCHGPDMLGVEAAGMTPPSPNPRPAVAQWTKEQFIGAMRSGVRPDGRKFALAMPWQAAAAMTDSDLAALYAYLRAPAAVVGSSTASR